MVVVWSWSLSGPVTPGVSTGAAGLKKGLCCSKNTNTFEALTKTDTFYHTFAQQYSRSETRGKRKQLLTILLRTFKFSHVGKSGKAVVQLVKQRVQDSTKERLAKQIEKASNSNLLRLRKIPNKASPRASCTHLEFLRSTEIYHRRSAVQPLPQILQQSGYFRPKNHKKET